jgi:hypothetical protein
LALEFFFVQVFGSTARDLCNFFREDGDYAAKKLIPSIQTISSAEKISIMERDSVAYMIGAARKQM